MVQVVSDLDDEELERLRARVRLDRGSVEREFHEFLSRAKSLSGEEKVALIKRFWALNDLPQTTDSTEIIRRDRDRDGP